MSGEKLKPLVIGKSAKPRCFSRIKPERLPVTYRNNKKAWMTSELMIDWLKSVDRQMKRSGRHILMFLDNAPAHPKVTLDNIKLVFLPANTTSVAQPMDQGIIQTLKLKYRSRQLKYILSQMEHSDKVGSTILREISILDAIYWINGSWKEVEASTIQKCFAKCGFTQFNQVCSDNDDDDDEVPLAVLRLSNELFGCTFSDLVDIDKAVPTFDLNTVNWDRNARI
ncbi:tigger transposable element-derived protein 6-like [Ruditapes philippinarum]|uniref:tigger transposable element-derived protein 6-like n=1 Tax=Ruditapes philippinarum TaxID=129788 RepID=UPI00295BAEC6|nr:tigger transposable element-derived protein 6-like [Ruditapes philippinarum]